MFGKRKQPPIRSLIAQGTVITGDVAFSDGLRVDGEVHGHVLAVSGHGSMLVVSETAKIHGEVRADLIVVNGHICGPVFANDLLELQPKARIEGDVAYAALEMHQGATITGKLQPTPALAEATAEKPPLTLAASNG